MPNLQTQPQPPTTQPSTIEEDDDDRPTLNSDTGQPNEGEGNRTAARRFDAAQEQYAKSGRVEDAAKEAKRALEGPEGDELRRAEEATRATAPVASERKQT